MVGSLFEPLNPTTREIRLLKVSDVPDGSLIECSLETVSLDDKPHFCALSYVWGDPNVTETINLNGRHWQVTVNLATALRYIAKQGRDALAERLGLMQWVPANLLDRILAKHDERFRLWIDALCINQADVRERNHQVQLMTAIYSGAIFVISWLCPPDEEIQSVLKFIPVMADEIGQLDTKGSDGYSLDWMKKHPRLFKVDRGLEWSFFGVNNFWKAFGNLLRLPYWKRAWIFQELVLAREPLLVCGSVRLDWEPLDAVCSFFLHIINEGRPPSAKPDWMCLAAWEAVSTYFTLNWKTLVRIGYARPPRPDNDETRWQLAWLGGELQATEARDHIYALLGLTQLALVPDYSDDKDTSTVYSEFIAKWLAYWRTCSEDNQPSTHSELHFLILSGVGWETNPHNLASWAPNFPEQSRDPNAAIGNISDTSAVLAAFSDSLPRGSVNGCSLFVNGVDCDDISEISSPLSELMKGDGDDEGSGLREYIFQLCGMNKWYPTGIPTLQAIARLLHLYSIESSSVNILDQAIATLDVLRESWTSRSTTDRFGIDRSSGKALYESLKAHVLPDLELDELAMSQLLENNDYHHQTNLLKNLMRNIARYDRHRIIRLRTGFLGLSLPGTATGDIVGYLNGFPGPVILRKAEGYYKFVGTCFIVGMMGSEGAEIVKTRRDVIKRFELR